TPESLAWREGIADWRPLRTFPELVAAISSAPTTPPSARPSQLPVSAVQSAPKPSVGPPPSAHRAPAKSLDPSRSSVRASGAETASGRVSLPPRPSAVPAPPAPAFTDGSASRPPATSAPPADPEPPRSRPAPAAAAPVPSGVPAPSVPPPPASLPVPSIPPPERLSAPLPSVPPPPASLPAPSIPAPERASASMAPLPLVSPVGASASPTSAAPLVPERVTAAGVGSDLEGSPQRRRSPVVAWVAVGGGALIVGLTLGRVIFGGGATAPVAPASVAEPAAQPPLPDLPAPPPPAPAEPEVTEASEGGAEVKARVQTRAPQVVTNRPAPTPTAAPESKLTGGLRSLGSGLSPSVGPRVDGGTSTGSTGGAELTSSQVQATVARYTGSVKRSCW